MAHPRILGGNVTLAFISALRFRSRDRNGDRNSVMRVEHSVGRALVRMHVPGGRGDVLVAGDVDLEKKLAVWERFYNFDRPHGAHGGKTQYEALREKLS
jgi:transposase InsO family protein